ncbi:MAG: tetratricopeptide repeat protein [Pseudomonadota bacterium]
MKSAAFSTCIKSIIVFLVAVSLFGCGGAEQRKAKYLEQAKIYIEQNNPDKARVELKNVLQIDPKHVEAYFLIGQLEEKRQNWDQAFGSYSKVVELDPNHVEARSKLGILYLLTGNIADATEMMERILAIQPNGVEGELLKAAILARQDKAADAVKLAEKIVAENPNHPSAASFLSSLYGRQGEKKKAVDLLQRAIQGNEKSTELRIQLARLYSVKTEADKIEKLLQENIAIEPAKLEHKIMLVGLYGETNQIDKAENILRAAAREKPEDAFRALLLVDFLAKKKSVALAEKELLDAVQANRKSYELRNVLADLYEKTGRADKAEAIYRETIDKEDTKPEGLKASVKLAKLLIGTGKTQEGEKLVRKVIEANPRDTDALLMQARLQLSKNEVQNAIVSLRAVLKDQPNSAETLVLLGEAHQLNNEPELAYDNFQKAVSENPDNAEARLRLAQYLVAAKQDTSGALAQIDAILKSAPSHMAALLAKADVMSMQRKPEAAKAVLESVVRSHPDSSVGYRALGQYYLDQKKYDAAIQQFETALGKTPVDSAYQALASVINVYMRQGKPDSAILRLKKTLAADENNMAAHELLGEVYISQKKYDEAKQEFRRAVAINPKWTQLYRSLAHIEAVQSGAKAAIPVYHEGLKAVPGDPGLLMMLAETHQHAGDIDSAIASYDQVLRDNPDHALALNNLVSLLLDAKGDSKSVARARELVQGLENSRFPPYLDTVGWTYYKSGEMEKAVKYLDQAATAAPNIAIFQFHLGMAYHKSGNAAKAKLHLGNAANAKQAFKEKEEALAILKQLP